MCSRLAWSWWAMAIVSDSTLRPVAVSTSMSSTEEGSLSGVSTTRALIDRTSLMKRT
jgi:hypothetical protein